MRISRLRPMSPPLWLGLLVGFLCACPPSGEPLPTLDGSGRPASGLRENAVTDPVERVRLFLEDYAAWSRAHGSGGDDPASLGAAGAGALELGRRHGVASDLVTRTQVVRSSRPLHGPEEEVLGTTTLAPERVVVETRTAADALFSGFYEYELARVDGDWRIARIDPYFHAADAPPPQTLPPEPWAEEAPDPTVFEDLSAYFDVVLTNGATVGAKEPVRLTRAPVGRVALSTGRIAVDDAGRLSHAVGPLARQLPPGDYPVEVVRAARPGELRVAAVVLVADPTRRAVRYTWAGNVTVDAGGIALVDLDAMRALRPRALERLVKRGVGGDEAVAHGVLAFDERAPPSLAFGRSGDGTFPIFWGLDDQGEPAHLVVDLLVAGRRPIAYADVAIDASRLPGPLAHPVLVAADWTLSASREGDDLTIEHEGNSPELALLDATSREPLPHGWRATNTRYTFVGGLAGGQTDVVVRVAVPGPYGLPGPGE